MDTNLVSTPKNQTAISFGINNVFYLMGSAIGPTLVGMYMQSNQVSINEIIGKALNTRNTKLTLHCGVVV